MPLLLLLLLNDNNDNNNNNDIDNDRDNNEKQQQQQNISKNVYENNPHDSWSQGNSIALRNPSKKQRSSIKLRCERQNEAWINNVQWKKQLKLKHKKSQ